MTTSVPFAFTSVSFADARNGVALNPFAVYSTQDGGLTWKHDSLPQVELGLLRCYAQRGCSGFCVTRFGNVYRRAQAVSGVSRSQPTSREGVRVARIGDRLIVTIHPDDKLISLELYDVLGRLLFSSNEHDCGGTLALDIGRLVPPFSPSVFVITLANGRRATGIVSEQ